MAVPHHEWKVYSRSQGASARRGSAYRTASGTDKKPYSAIAASAYGARTETWDKRYVDKPHDYSHKADELVWHQVFAPPGAPDWVYDHKKLWTAVEEREDKSNHRKTAQLFRGMVQALPHELTLEQNKAWVTKYVVDTLVSRGMIVQVDFHWKDGNWHCHMMATMRDISAKGFGLKRRDWNEIDFINGKNGRFAKARKDGILHQQRNAWAEYQNAALAAAGSAARIDPRTLAAQGIAREPQPKLGKVKHIKRLRGYQAARWTEYHSINMRNRMRGQVVDAGSEEAAYQVGNTASGMDVTPRKKRQPEIGQAYEP